MATHSTDTSTKAATGFGTNAEGDSSATQSNKKRTAGSNPAPKPKAKKEKRKPYRKSAKKSQSVIPQVVSNRMIKRALIFTGIPTVLSFAILPLSLVARNQELFDLPPTVVFAGSLGCLAIGFVGITFSLLSASWDEDVPGSLLGIRELKLNWSRFQETRKANQEQQNS